ncbi:hypothetical protein Taro_034822, partial [Colocasia esculenta]|nr:hypothetical protein [Colocasia esculenta]
MCGRHKIPIFPLKMFLNHLCARNLEEVLSNGDIYIGEFQGLLPHGKGKYVWLDGTVFEGEWERSRMSGKGKICWPSGAKYEGDLCGGFLHGSGALTGADGSVYEGSWRMNIQHGLGTKRYHNSDTYEGLWREGVQEGVGKYVWDNGNMYFGNWKAGKMCGRGVMKWANGDLFDGIWLDGLKHGSGCYKFGDGSFYFGTWSRGLKDGHGVFYPSGSKHPVLTNWYDSLKSIDGIQGVHFHSTSQYSFSDNKHKPASNIYYKWPISSFLKCSGRISHRNASDSLWVPGDLFSGIPSQDYSSGYSSSSEDHNIPVYEREYAQGVLIMEYIRNPTCGIPGGINWLQMLRPKEARGPCKTIRKGDKSYYLMLNLQLGIRNLREMFKLDAADYMMSICDGDSLKELSSPGKSGSIFYLSQDERFVIKTLKKSELKVGFLPHLYRQISVDCKFLESQHIIDYSLLLGVHFRAPELSLQDFQDADQSYFSSRPNG